mgnify:CR=1 FL=1
MKRIIGIDLNAAHVHLACREGDALRTARLPAEPPRKGWPKWIARLALSAPYEVVFRTDTDAGMAAEIEALARSHGATCIRIVPQDNRHDPARIMLHELLPRLRVGELPFLQIGARRWQCGVMDRRGQITVHQSGEGLQNDDMTKVGPYPADLLRALFVSDPDASSVATVPAPLVAFGDQGPALAADMAESAGLRRVLVPDYAASLTAVGMLLMDRVLIFREVLPPQTKDATQLRYAFARLMDEAARAVTLEGCDIDDTICRRYVEVGSSTENDQPFEIECGSLVDLREMLDQYRESFLHRHGHPAPPDAHILAACINVTIEKIPTPLPPMSWRSIPHAGPPIPGPTDLHEAEMAIHVPAGWHASRSNCGVMLERAESS